MEGCRSKQRKDTVHRDLRGVQFRSKINYRNKGNASAKKQGEGEGILERSTGVQRRNKNENVFAWRNGLRENDETSNSCRGPGPARKKRCTSSRGKDEDDAHMCPCGKAVEGTTHSVGECGIYKEEWDV